MEHRGIFPRMIAEQLLTHAVGIAAIKHGVSVSDDADIVLFAIRRVALFCPCVFISEDIFDHAVGKAQVCIIQYDGDRGGEQDRLFDVPQECSRALVFVGDHKGTITAFCGEANGVLNRFAVVRTEKARVVCNYHGIHLK